MNLTRELVAAWLRARGYTHDDEADPRDLYWRRPDGGYSPILACLADEMNHDIPSGQVYGWDTYSVAVGVPATEASHEEEVGTRPPLSIPPTPITPLRKTSC